MQNNAHKLVYIEANVDNFKMQIFFFLALLNFKKFPRFVM